MLHRPYEKDYGWQVSEYYTGKLVAPNINEKMIDAENQAENNLNQIECNDPEKIKQFTNQFKIIN